MKGITDRYSSPVQPPRLVPSRMVDGRTEYAPRVSLRGGSTGPARRLVSFEWGRVEPSRLGR